jgi:hypothetical protein
MLEEMEPENEEDEPITPTGVRELQKFGMEILEELPIGWSNTRYEVLCSIAVLLN